jgi:hypothetical protein
VEVGSQHLGPLDVVSPGKWMEKENTGYVMLPCLNHAMEGINSLHLRANLIMMSIPFVTPTYSV